MTGNDIVKALEENGFRFEKEFTPMSTDVSEYLKRHDIVFKSPQNGGFEGLPFGNGDIGGMIWTTDTGIDIQLNKNDLWSEPDEEGRALLRSCGQIHLDFCQPCNEWIYLKDFEARLSLGEGKITIVTETPFCRISCEFWTDAEQNLLVGEITYNGEETENIFRVSIDRYGSRSMRSWYSEINREAEIGLGETRIFANEEGIFLDASFPAEEDPCLTIAASVIDADFSAKKVNSRTAEMELSVENKKKITLLISAAVADESLKAKEEAKTILLSGENDLSVRKSKTAEWWKTFWNHSFFHISKPEEEKAYDYLENLYYIQMYALACSSRGKYPMLFCGGLFTWNHDVRQWTTPHHWNMQQSYWSVEAANHPELMEPYVNAYFSMIPQAKEHAKKIAGMEHGMIISEAHDYKGRMVLYPYAFTPASQIAQQFWNHYLFNGDMEFLKEKAYPFIRECAEFYAEYAKKDACTGKYIVSPSAVYECDFGHDFSRSVVDITMMRYIFPVAIKAAEILKTDEEKITRWKEILENLEDYVYWDENEKETLCVGLRPDGEKADFGPQNQTFCRDTSPLVPCAVIGSEDKGSRLYQAVYHAAEQYGRSALAISPIPVVWDRLDDGDRAVKYLFYAVDQLQHFPQGFYYNIDHWYQYSRYADKVEQKLVECQRDYIYDRSLCYPNIRDSKNRDITINTPMEPMVQAGFETPGILTQALHEMALQSFEKVIRVFPAVPEDTSIQFTLKAAGGFLVTARAENGKAVPVVIVKSLIGNTCRIKLPFEDAVLCNVKGESVTLEKEAEESICFETEAGETYIIYGRNIRKEELPSIKIEDIRNDEYKKYGYARIGSERTY